jgi:hypothetical protein
VSGKPDPASYRINRYPVEPKMDFNRLELMEGTTAVIDSFDSPGYLAEPALRYHVPPQWLNTSGEETR